MVAVEQRVIERLIRALDLHDWQRSVVVLVAHDVVLVDAVPALVANRILIARVRGRVLDATEVVHQFVRRDSRRPAVSATWLLPVDAREQDVAIVRVVAASTIVVVILANAAQRVRCIDEDEVASVGIIETLVRQLSYCCTKVVDRRERQRRRLHIDRAVRAVVVDEADMARAAGQRGGVVEDGLHACGDLTDLSDVRVVVVGCASAIRVDQLHAPTARAVTDTGDVGRLHGLARQLGVEAGWEEVWAVCTWLGRCRVTFRDGI